MIYVVTIRIQVTERVAQECSRFASLAGIVGSIVGAACVVSVVVVLITSIH